MKMTKERIVNLVLDYYIRQKNEFGIENTGECRYRTDGDDCRYCAIGFLASKSRNSEKFFEKNNDNSDYQSVSVVGMEIFRYIYMDPNKENLKFLGDVQDLHDRFAVLHHRCPELEYDVCKNFSPKITDANNKNFSEAMKSLIKD
jgi:hypothetical protein